MKETPRSAHGHVPDRFSSAHVVWLVQRGLERTTTLSARQKDVLRLVSLGFTNSQICGRLGIAPATVESHVKDLKYKLAVDSRSLLAVIGYFDTVSKASRAPFHLDQNAMQLIHSQSLTATSHPSQSELTAEELQKAGLNGKITRPHRRR